jgi:hypothetical protein
MSSTSAIVRNRSADVSRSDTCTPSLIETIAFIAHPSKTGSTTLPIPEHGPFHDPPDVPSIAPNGV